MQTMAGPDSVYKQVNLGPAWLACFVQNAVTVKFISPGCTPECGVLQGVIVRPYMVHRTGSGSNINISVQVVSHAHSFTSCAVMLGRQHTLSAAYSPIGHSVRLP